MAEFRMPSLGADMEAGTLIEWRIKPGDRVRRGDVVAVVETQKGAIEVEIFTTGVVEAILVPVGEPVPVGTPLALIHAEGEAHAPPSTEATGRTAVSAAAPARAAMSVPAAPGAARLRVSPAARKRATELGLDLEGLAGSGPGGAITLDDVEKAAVARPPGPPTERATGMRQAIGAAMARSKREIPHYYLGSFIDMGRALDWLRGENERRPVPQRLLPGALLLKAVALALRQVPELNGFWVDGGFKAGAGIHPGSAIVLRGGGLVAPAVHDADSKSLDEVMADLRDLVQRARAGALRSSELSDATITVTSLGEQGVETVFGVIYPPQVALVGLGRIAERPWVVGGQVVARPLVHATLSADHRASDGHRGARFLSLLDQLLQEPERL